MPALTHALIQLAILPIRAYRLFLSPWLGARCRFVPSCSQYAEEAMMKHGFWRGAKLASLRLFRCHPWGKSGYDPVPQGKHS